MLSVLPSNARSAVDPVFHIGDLSQHLVILCCPFIFKRETLVGVVGEPGVGLGAGGWWVALRVRELGSSFCSRRPRSLGVLLCSLAVFSVSRDKSSHIQCLGDTPGC